jgi:hypothetical protein
MMTMRMSLLDIEPGCYGFSAEYLYFRRILGLSPEGRLGDVDWTILRSQIFYLLP